MSRTIRLDRSRLSDRPLTTTIRWHRGRGRFDRDSPVCDGHVGGQKRSQGSFEEGGGGSNRICDGLIVRNDEATL